MKEAIARKKDAHKEMCKSGTEVKKARYKNMKNRAKKVVAKAMKEAPERELRGLSEHPNNNGGQNSLERIWKTFLPEPLLFKYSNVA